MESNLHIPVLKEEVLEALAVTPGRKYIDCTLGAGGHSLEILQRGGLLLGIEADRTMLVTSKERLKKFCPTLLQGNFAAVKSIAQTHGFEKVDGILFDLGVSSYHYLTLNRGFSVKEQDSSLDMRLEPEVSAVTAAELLNILPEEKLSEVFSQTLARNEIKHVVRQIVEKRSVQKFSTVSDLTNLFHKGLPEIFLALRMTVNDELNVLRAGLLGACDLLNTGGKMIVISFHSGEDKEVFKIFKILEKDGKGILDTKKPIVPTEVERSENPKSRSALMRIFTKI